jgi:hypothetical protein
MGGNWSNDFGHVSTLQGDRLLVHRFFTFVSQRTFLPTGIAPGMISHHHDCHVRRARRFNRLISLQNDAS